MDRVTSAMERNFLALSKTERKSHVRHHMRGITGQEEKKKCSAILSEAELRGKTILYNLVIDFAIAWWVEDKWGKKFP